MIAPRAHHGKRPTQSHHRRSYSLQRSRRRHLRVSPAALGRGVRQRQRGVRERGHDAAVDFLEADQLLATVDPLDDRLMVGAAELAGAERAGEPTKARTVEAITLLIGHRDQRPEGQAAILRVVERIFVRVVDRASN